MTVKEVKDFLRDWPDGATVEIHRVVSRTKYPGAGDGWKPLEPNRIRVISRTKRMTRSRAAKAMAKITMDHLQSLPEDERIKRVRDFNAVINT